MKGSSNDNGKISDSGYTNTCVIQSQRSIDSSSLAQKTTNQSENGGYSGGNTLTSDSSNYVLPQPLSRRKENSHKKTKSKASNVCTERRSQQINSGKQNNVGRYDSNGSSSDFATNSKKKEEIADVKLMDDIGLGEHDGDTNSTEFDRGSGMITNSLGDTTPNINATFSVVISMKNGLVVEVTPTLNVLLGYTKESWINRSFIEFVHPKDKQTFTDHLAKNIVLPQGDRVKGLDERPKGIFCNLRENGEPRSKVGSGSDESSNPRVTTSNRYLPFHLVMSIKVFRDPTSTEKRQMIFLIIKAEPIMPIYKAPEEMILSKMFSTRHDCNCILTHVEVDVVRYLGFMPQDMIGRSLFEFYHPDDLPSLKEVYEIVLKTEGLAFHSTPHRFATQNGDYVVLDTEWSAFFSPWSEKIELVVGNHRVLRGPTNPDVFRIPNDCQRNFVANVSEEVMKESEIMQGEIRAILNKKPQRTENNDASEISSSSKNLNTFVKMLLREVMPPAPVFKKHCTAEDKILLKHDTNIMSAKSPHDGYCDSKSSTETPPSYGQLNYNDKITRYFDSNLPINPIYGSDEDDKNLSVPSNKDNSNPSSNLTGTKNTTLSGENLSSGSNNRTSYNSCDDSDIPQNTNPQPTRGLKMPRLTKSVLNKHNQKMEQLLVQQHKEWRCKMKNSNENKDSKTNGTQDRPNNKRSQDQTRSSGAKKRKIENREGEECKIPKCDVNTKTCTVAPQLATPKAPVSLEDKITPETAPTHNLNFCPSVTQPVPVQPPHSHFYMTAPNTSARKESKCPELSSVVPLYCVPLPGIHNHPVSTPLPTTNQLPKNSRLPQITYASYTPVPLAGVIYPPIVCPPETATTLYGPFLLPGPAPIHHETTLAYSAIDRRRNLSECTERPASPATSIKGELGSTVALSEDSTKVLHILGEQLSSCISNDGGCLSPVSNMKRETNGNIQFTSSLEDSSDSSFYDSFLTKSNGNSYDRSEIIDAQQRSQNTLWNCTNDVKMQSELLPRGPSWQAADEMSEELIYQYQLTPKPLNEVLEADMKILRNFKQPSMVSDQLIQMYSDMELSTVDLPGKLILCECNMLMDGEHGSCNDGQRNIPLELNE